MKFDSSSRASDEQSSNSKLTNQHQHHRILFSRNNTYNSEYSAGGGGYGLSDYDSIHSNQHPATSSSRIPGTALVPAGGSVYEKQESVQSLTNLHKSDLDPPSHLLLSDSFPTLTNIGSFHFVSINYLLFCFSFSLSCAPVICSLIYSPAVIGNEIGALGNGCFYLSYALFTLLFGKIIIYSLGCLRSFLLSHLCTFFYILSFIYYSNSDFHRHHQHHHHLQRILFYSLYFFSTSLGGMAQGLNWMAHSKYYSKSCQMLITSMNISEIEKMNRQLSFQFATIYFLILIGIFIACSLVIGNPGDISHPVWLIVIPSYLTIFVLSGIIYSLLDNYGDIGGMSGTGEGGRGGAGVYPLMRKPFQEFRSIIFAVRSLPSLMKLKLCL
jgi:hypothetical protein